MLRRLYLAGLLLAGLLGAACGGARGVVGSPGVDGASPGSFEGDADEPRSDGGAPPQLPMLVRRFVTSPRPACEFSAPLAIVSQGSAQILIATADGVFTAVDPTTGAEVWRVALTAQAGTTPHLVAPPTLVGSRLVFGWQEVTADWTRVSHRLGVLNLEMRALDPAFPTVTLSARQAASDGASTIDFVPAHAYGRAALVHADLRDHELGVVYASYGNARDLQPWHGWVFELDLDEWRAQGAAAAITASFVTTADVDCGPENGDGSRQMACGGGVWTHLGPQVVYDDGAADGFYLLLPTGNGLLDPSRKAFANSVLRLEHGLRFDPACDAAACEPFDPLSPSEPCMSSCTNLAMPRLLATQMIPDAPNDACQGKSLLGCYALLDWDLGANSPARVKLPGGPAVVVMPGKDGAVYLFDGDHLGTLYDRAPIMPVCGVGGANCLADWAGTIVTRPAIVTVDGAVLALVPTFIEDDAHAAGLQALEISMATGAPQLLPRWRAPSPSDPDALSGFRQHSGGVTVVDVGGEPFAALVDDVVDGGSGTLYWIRVRDGTVVQKVGLAGSGMQFVPPLAANGALYMPSCQRTGTPQFNLGPSTLEAYTISAVTVP